MRIVRPLGIAAAAAALTVLAACGTTPAPEPSRGVGESGVELWPQYGDFAMEANKAVQPAEAFRVDGEMESYDYLQRIAMTPQARWVGDFTWDQSNTDRTRTVLRAARDQERVGLLAVAGDPFAQCDVEDTPEAYAAALDQYDRFLDAVIAPTADYAPNAWVIYEPGTLENIDDCATAERYQLMSAGITRLSDAGYTVYIDAGGAGELTPEEAAIRLDRLPNDGVAGFAIGIGEFRSDEDEAAWGDALVEEMAARGWGNLRYVIDTSRNGLPIDANDLCNPPDIAIGKAPRIVNQGNLAGYAWIKRPGESDGSCNGGTESGTFWVVQAMELARNGDPATAG